MTKPSGRIKDRTFNSWLRPDGGVENWDDAKLQVLQDIRDELKQLNAILGCTRFLRIPQRLDAIYAKMPPKQPKVKK